MEDYLVVLLEKLAKEKKKSILMGDFNINNLNRDPDRDTSSFIATIYSKFFISHNKHSNSNHKRF